MVTWSMARGRCFTALQQVSVPALVCGHLALPEARAPDQLSAAVTQFLEQLKPGMCGTVWLTCMKPARALEGTALQSLPKSLSQWCMSVSSDNTVYIQIFECFTYSMLQYNNRMLPVATYTVHCTVVSYVVAECQLGHRLATLCTLPWGPSPGWPH